MIRINRYLVASTLVPPLGLPLGFIGLYRDFCNWRKYIFCLALCVWGFAYAYYPDSDGPDLSRYFDYVDFISKYGFLEAFDIGYENGFVPVHTFMSWVVGRLGDSHLLAAFNATVVYYVGLYIVCRIAEDICVSTKNVILSIILLIMTSYFSGIVNNVRNIFAFSLVVVAVFRDVYLAKCDFLTFFCIVCQFLFIQQQWFCCF